MTRKSNTGIVVLSVFDGMSCGQIALQRARVPVKAYYASEINKYAIKATMNNFPNTIQLGDICNIHIKDLPEVPDIIIGGSPCQGFSRAGKGLNFDDPRSKLFFEYVRLWNEIKAINPNAKFLLENVRMLKEWENIISKFMGINPVTINSSLVSAQNRERLYWNNFNLVKYGLFDCVKNEIPQPKDKKIFLKDILESEVAEKYFLSDAMLGNLFKRKRVDNLTDMKRKACTFTAGAHSGGLHSDMDIIAHNTQSRTGDPLCVAMRGRNPENPKSRITGLETEQRLEVNETGKTNSLTTVTKVNLVSYTKNYIQWDASGKGYKSQQDRAFFEHGKMGTLSTQGLEGKCKIITSSSRIRRLTPKECCRLQTVPDNYFHDSNGVQVISDSRIYECLGNGWTVDVIVHLLNYYKQTL